jgi:hypothetical protein
MTSNRATTERPGERPSLIVLTYGGGEKAGREAAILARLLF